jgi:hypothetical protein
MNRTLHTMRTEKAAVVVVFVLSGITGFALWVVAKVYHGAFGAQ